MKKLFALMVGLALIFSPLTIQAKELTVDEVQQGVCRVVVRDYGFGVRMNSRTSCGTGTVIKQDQGKYYILTCGHVVGYPVNRAIFVEFFRDGYKSKVISAHLEWMRYQRGTSIDVALLSIPDNVFAKTSYKPTIIPVGPRQYKVEKGIKVYGAGCPRGDWCQYWNARLNAVKQTTLTFNMPPLGGQSGSSILTTIVDPKGEAHTAVIGLLAWRFDAGTSYGGGLNLFRIHEIFDGKPKRDYVESKWSAMAAEQDDDPICNSCGKPRSQHVALYNVQTKEYAHKENSNRISLWCIDRMPKATNSNILVQCPNCPNGQCPFYYGQPQPNPYYGQQQGPPFTNEPPKIDSPWPEFENPQQPPAQMPPPVLPPAPVQPQPTLPLMPAPVPGQPVPPPPLVGPSPDPTADLKAKIETLQGSLEKANNDKAALQADNDKKGAAVASQMKAEHDANTKADAATKAKADAEAKADTANKAKAASDIKAASAAQQAQGLQTKVDQLVAQHKAAVDKLAEVSKAHEQDVNAITNKFNIPYVSAFFKTYFGGFGSFLSALFGVLASGSVVTALWHNYLYPYLVKNWGYIPTKIVGAIGNRQLRKILNNTSSEKKTSKITDDKNPNLGYNSSVGSEQTTQLPTDIPQPPSSHVEQLFASGHLNGITPKEWAIKAGLYKEAVDKLRKGELVTSDGIMVFNSLQAAESVEAYVRNKFVNQTRFTDSSFPSTEQSAVVNQAYLGYLYWLGVEKLRNGEFTVLGYQQAADAIEHWVQSELMKKV